MLGLDQSVAIAELFENWIDWCEDSNLPPGSKKAFGIALRAAYTWRAWNIAVFFELAHIMSWKKKICKYIEHYDKD